MPTKLLLMYSTHEPTVEHIKAIELRLGEDTVLIASSEEDAIRKVPDVEIIWGHRYLRQVLPFAERLRWVQSSAGGVDRLPLEDLARKQIILTRSTVSSKTIARHTHTLIWMLIRGLHTSYGHQLRRQYIKQIPMLPQPKKALVLGTGAIGCALAGVLKKDGIFVVGVNQSGIVPNNFDEVVTGPNWHDVLPNTDVIILTLPFSSATVRMVDYKVLERLPSHAIVVNVGRAETLDTPALLKLLRQKRLGGAALDVVPKELIQDDSIIWETPNLIVTPYNSAHSIERTQLLEGFCLKQLERYLGGERLDCMVSF